MLRSTRVGIRITAQTNGDLLLAMDPEERLAERLTWVTGLGGLLMDSRMARSRRRQLAVPCPSRQRFAWRHCVISTTHTARTSGRPRVFGMRTTCERVGGVV